MYELLLILATFILNVQQCESTISCYVCAHTPECNNKPFNKVSNLVRTSTGCKYCVKEIDWIDSTQQVNRTCETGEKYMVGCKGGLEEDEDQDDDGYFDCICDTFLCNGFPLSSYSLFTTIATIFSAICFSHV